MSCNTTYQLPRFWSKLLAVAWNMPDMSVADETFQVDTSPLKARATANMPLMSVTEETSQLERLPLKRRANLNISDMSVTEDRSGASVARYTMFVAKVNAFLIDSHRISPHCSIDSNFGKTSG